MLHAAHTLADERESRIGAFGLVGSTDLLIGAACTCIRFPGKFRIGSLNALLVRLY